MRAAEFSGKPHLYLDMDGVQADFFTAWAQWHAKKYNQPNIQRYKDIGDQESREISVKELSAEGPEFVKHFFATLDHLPGGKKLIGWLRQNEIPFTILSAPLRDNHAASEEGKRYWIDHDPNLGPGQEAIFTDKKFRFATANGQPNVLVDDFKKYVSAWTQAGGIGILYRDDQVDQVIAQLAEIYKIDQDQPVDESSYMDYNIHDYLANKGYKWIGSGADQTTFLAPNKQLVLKIFGTRYNRFKNANTAPFTKDQLMFFDWSNYCSQHQDNPFLPKFIIGQGGKPWREFVFDGRKYLQIWQERLKPMDSPTAIGLYELAVAVKTHPLDQIYDMLNNPKAYRWANRKFVNQVRKKLGDKKFDLMLHTISEIAELGHKKKYYLDLHMGNFLSRYDGTPVIADPWSIPSKN